MQSTTVTDSKINDPLNQLIKLQETSETKTTTTTKIVNTNDLDIELQIDDESVLKKIITDSIDNGSPKLTWFF